MRKFFLQSMTAEQASLIDEPDDILMITSDGSVKDQITGDELIGEFTILWFTRKYPQKQLLEAYVMDQKGNRIQAEVPFETIVNVTK